MRHTARLTLVAALCLLNSFSNAAEKPDAAEQAALAAPTANWLNDKGVLELDALVKDLAATPTPSQKEALARALEARNATLLQANDRFSSELKKILGVDDNKQAQTAIENRRLNRIKRLQPGRYQGIDKGAGKVEKEAQGTNSSP